VIKNASLVISLSETEKKDLNQLYGTPLEKIVVIPGGVNLHHFVPIPKDKAQEKLNIPKQNFNLLFVGRLEWRKGIGTLISTVRLLKQEIPNIRAIIVGGRIYGKQKNHRDFREYQRLLKKAEEEGVRDIINFVGRIDNSNLPFFYSAADAFIIPSYYEPFGLVALEAMACKVPVIASQVGGLQTTIADGITGLLFKPRNPLDLKEKILKIYKSKDLAATLANNAYNKVKEEYSWKNIANKIDGVYKSLLIK
jgi:glycosyltransferase involved in cell wall biosynthesis